MLATLVLVLVGWVIFRAGSFGELWVYLTRMFTEWTWLDRGETLGLSWSAVLACLLCWQYCATRWRWREVLVDRLPAPVQGLAMATAIVLVAMFRVDEVAFIYFQF